MRRFQALLIAAGLAAAPASAAAGTNSNSKTAPPASEVSHDKGRPVGKNQAVSIGLLRDKRPITVEVTLNDEPRDVWSRIPVLNELMRSFFQPIHPTHEPKLRT